MKNLSSYTEQRQTELFKETGAFFAFGQKQFDEKKVEGVKYVALDGGLIVPAENAKALLQGLSTIHEEGIKMDIEENGKSAIIQRELANHEASYTMCTDATKEALEGYGFTDEEIQAEFDTYFAECVANDSI